MRVRFIVLLFFIVSLSSCLRTAEQIERDKMVDSMAVGLKQNQSMAAEMVVRFKEFETKINELNGKIEESNYQIEQSLGKKQDQENKEIAQLKELVNTLNKNYQKQSKELAELKVKMKEQDGYIKKVNKTLKKLTNTKAPSVDKRYKSAIALYEKKKFKKAEEIFLDIVDEKKLSASRRNRVLQSLGMISYRSKRYEEAIVFFSRIYTNYPKSSFAPFALLNIGKSLKNIGEKDQAKVSFSELLNKYPKSKHAQKAKSELDKLQ
jgi:TolA-binding protein